MAERWLHELDEDGQALMKQAIQDAFIAVVEREGGELRLPVGAVDGVGGVKLTVGHEGGDLVFRAVRGAVPIGGRA